MCDGFNGPVITGQRGKLQNQRENGHKSGDPFFTYEFTQVGTTEDPYYSLKVKKTDGLHDSDESKDLGVFDSFAALEKAVEAHLGFAEHQANFGVSDWVQYND